MNKEPKITLQNLYNHFAQSPESRWIMEAPNAIDLYKFIQRNPIKNVLDLGLGIGVSASVAALALKDKGEKDFKVTSLEQFDKCITLANQLIPKELKEHIEILKGEVEVISFDKIPYTYFSAFKNIPDGKWDLIVVDGPAPFMQKDLFVDLPNGDLMRMLLENKIAKGTFIVYDGRLNSLKAVERFYGENFQLAHLAARGSDFNVLERIGDEVVYRDEVYEMMKNQTSYFLPANENTLPPNK